VIYTLAQVAVKFAEFRATSAGSSGESLTRYSNRRALAISTPDQRGCLVSLREEQALRAYTTMMNILDAAHLEPLLADDFHYASQWVFDEIESKSAYLEYIVQKLEAIRESGSTVWAETPTVTLHQGT